MAFLAYIVLALLYRSQLSLCCTGNCDEDSALYTSLVKCLARNHHLWDISPRTPVVSQLSLELLQLKAGLTALEARVEASQNVPSVSFTSRFSKQTITGLKKDQVLVFDVDVNNIGGGYDTKSGYFTAPVAGSYVFYLAMQRNDEEERTFMALIMKGSTSIGVAEAGYSPYEHGSMLVTTHLERGDTVCVKVHVGTTVYGSMSTVFSGFLL